MDDRKDMDTVQKQLWLPLTPAAAGLAESLHKQQYFRFWSLVLAARDIPHRLEYDPPAWRLLAPDHCMADAIREVRLYEEENRHWPPAPPAPRPLVENSLATLSVLILLAVFHNITLSDMVVINGVTPDWLSLGLAQGAKIRGGEWWRLVTALTLHADMQHLLSNLAIGGIFVLLLCRELGSGLAWSLLLVTGVTGNLLNSLLQAPGHSFIGASTAVFGAIGILAALSMIRYRRHQQRRWLLPIAAALSLLVLLGTKGTDTDLGAHLFGFLSGIAMGLLVELLIARYGHPGRLLDTVLGLLSLLAVTTAWWLALT